MKFQEFKITYNGTETTLTINPGGWAENGQKWQRDRIYHGVFQTATVDTFRFSTKSGGGGDIILAAYEADDIKALVTVEVSNYNPQTGGYDVSYTGRLNFDVDQFKIDPYDRFVEVGFIQSGDIQNFLNRDEIDLNLRDNVSLDGVTITDVDSDNITFKGISVNSQAQAQGLYNGSVNFNSETTEKRILFTEGTEQINEIGDRYQLNSGSETIYTNDLTTNSILRVGVLAAERDQLIRAQRAFFPPLGTITIQVGYVLRDSDDDNLLSGNVFQYVQDLSTAPLATEKIFTFPMSIDDGSGGHSFIDVTVPASGYLELYTSISYTPRPGNDGSEIGVLEYDQILPTNILIYEKSTSIGDTSVNGWFSEEVFTKIFRLILSNDDVYYSTFTGKASSTLQSYSENGDAALDFVTHGYNIRGYPNRQIITNLREAFQSFDGMNNLMMGYDYQNNRFYIEKKEAAYDSENILFDLGEVKSLKISPYKDAYVNKVMAGYDDEADYEEFQGATAFNLKSDYSIDQPVKSDLKMRSTYRTESIEMEIARRYPYVNFASTDTDQDEKIFVVRTDGSETIQGGTNLSGFAGIEERYNIALTPRENVIRWGNFLRAMHWKEGSFTVKFTAAKKAVNISYQNSNGDQVNEQDDIDSSELGTLRLFNPQYYEFEGVFDLEKAEAIKQNPHGLINFTYLGEPYSIFIDELQSKDYDKLADYKGIAFNAQDAVEMIWNDTTDIDALFEDEQQILFD